MKTRIRDRWRNPDQQQSAEKNGEALGYVCWQLALTAGRNLHAEDFIYQDDVQRVAVIREYLIFLVHAADRLAFDNLEQTDRAALVPYRRSPLLARDNFTAMPSKCLVAATTKRSSSRHSTGAMGITVNALLARGCRGTRC